MLSKVASQLKIHTSTHCTSLHLMHLTAPQFSSTLLQTSLFVLLVGGVVCKVIFMPNPTTVLRLCYVVFVIGVVTTGKQQNNPA